MSLPREKRELLEAELEAGECLLWSGQPDPRRWEPAAVAAFFFGILWSGAVSYFASSFWQLEGLPDLGPVLALIPFLLIGVSMMLAPAWASFRAVRTAYGLTDKRVLIVRGGRTRRVESYGRADLGAIKRDERPDGTGTLTFARFYTRDSDGDKQMIEVQFVSIPAVREVEMTCTPKTVPFAK